MENKVKPKVSICMIVKDKEKDLERCLDSFMPIILEDWCELIVVDTGSSDRCIEVAKKHLATVYEKTFVPWNFSDARNYAMSKATGEYVFTLDSDEELPQESMYPMKELLWSLPKEEPTVFLHLRNIFSKNNKQYTHMIQPRIFRNDPDFKYDGSVHNKPNAKGPFFFPHKTIFLNHYGYKFEGDGELAQEKYDRSLPMLLEEHEKEPHNTHWITHIIKTYRITGELDKVVKFGELWIEEMKKVKYHEGWFAYLEVFIDLVDAYLRKNDLDNALRVKELSLAYSDRLPDMHMLFGSWYVKNSRAEEAKDEFERALDICITPSNPYELLLTSNVETSLGSLFNWLAIYYFQIGDFAKAGHHLNMGIQHDPYKVVPRWDIWNCDQEIEMPVTCYFCKQKIKEK